jgi:hypothetical protein
MILFAADENFNNDILLLADCSFPGEWEGQVRYLPLR